jgi:Uma2 family endonuclease
MTPPKQADPTRLPTLADLDALPPGIVGEIIEGVLYTMTKPRMPHQLIGLEIGSDLLGPFAKGRGGPGGWWIVANPGIERPDNTLEISPDVGGWCRERMPKAPHKRAIRVVPDWVCEILSPTTRHHDLVDKMPYYAKIGVPYAWLVDLEARTVIVHRLEAGRWVTLGYYSDETDARIEPFEAVPLNVAGWWLPADAIEDEP